MKKRIFFFAIALLCSTLSKAQTAPSLLYNFDGSNPLAPSVGTGNLNPAGTTYNILSGGQVGKYFQLPSSTSQYITGGTVNPTNGICVQLLIRAGYNFSNTRNGQLFWIGNCIGSYSYDQLTFSTTTQTASGQQNDDLNVTFDGVNRKSWNYLADGNWHILAFNYNCVTGLKQIWIDGACPTGFSKSAPIGTIAIAAQQTLYINQSVNYIKIYADLDELAYYTTGLDPRQIYQNYVDAMINHVGYTTAFASSVPSPPNCQGSLNPNDFATGTVLPSVTNPTVGVTTTPIAQLQSYPIPRFKAGNTLNKLFNASDPMYEGQRFQPGVSDAQAVTNSTNIQLELAKNYNYMIQLGYDPTNPFSAAWNTLANANTQYKTSFITLSAQLNPTTLIRDQNQSITNYMQNSSGSIIDQYGNAYTGFKFWRPVLPENLYTQDGLTMRSYLQPVIAAQTARPANRKIDWIYENGEIFSTFSNNGMNTDPRVRDSVNSSGLGFQGYYAYKVARNQNIAYKGQFMNLAGLENCKYQYYAMDGNNTGQNTSATDLNIPYRLKWLYSRTLMDTIRGHYMATPDIYVLGAQYWKANIRSITFSNHSELARGYTWLGNCITNQIALNDSFFSPFVSPGWSGIEEQNTRPAQWLGILKNLHNAGAEHMFVFFASLSPPWQNSANWIWEMAYPAYSQAILSRYESFFRHSYVMDGDVPADWAGGGVGYNFYAGDIGRLTVVRKYTGANKYIISSNINTNVNIYGNSPDSALATITLDGSSVSFYTRRQGSVYYYDNSVSPPIFYQMDGWHENTFPSLWSTNFYFEAENYDSSSTGVTVSTQRNGASAGDFSSFTSRVNFAGVDSVTYSFNPRTVATQYLYVRARSTDGTSTGFNVRLDGGSAKAITCITDTNWLWYRYNTSDAAAITWTSLSAAAHSLRLTSTSSKIAIDKITISSTDNLYTSAPIPCGSATATITPSGTTTFCQGGSVTLTANVANSYLWSTGATSQAIVATTSGLYTVTVTITGIGTATSSATQVTVLSNPTATITPSGATTFCNGSSVTLTANSQTSYLWSTAATTQGITASTAGTYTVTVTGSNGCTTASAPVVVTVNTSPSSVITAGGATTFCSGSSVTLSANTGTGLTYLWYKNAVSTGTTTQTLVASTAGSYTCSVTQSGCSSASNAISVSVTTPPTTSNAGADQTVCSTTAMLAGNTPVNGTGTWTLISGIGTITSASSPTSGLTALAVGDNVFRWTILNGTCTPSSDDVTITRTGASVPSITISASKGAVCGSGETVTFTAAPVNQGTGSYAWTKNGSSTGSNAISISISVVPTDVVVCTLTSDLGCVTTPTAVSNTITITQATTPTATITLGGSTTFCSGGSVLLTSSTCGSCTYQWYSGASPITGATSTTYTATTAATYSVLITSSNSCTAQSSGVAVTVNARPTATITPSGNTTFCSGDSLLLTASSASSYLWSNAKTTSTIYVTTTGTYTVLLTAANGCTQSSSGMSITVNTSPNLSISNSTGSTTPCIGATAVLSSNYSTGNVWSTGALTQSINTTSSGTYACTTTQSGCSDRDSVTLTFINCSTDCNAPTGLNTTQISTTSAKLNWTAAVNATSYVIEVTNTKTGVVYQPLTISADFVSARINKLKSGTRYTWRIKTLCGTTGLSNYSGKVGFTTKR